MLNKKKLTAAVLSCFMVVTMCGTMTGCKKETEIPEETAIEEVDKDKNIIERLTGKTVKESIESNEFIKKFNDAADAANKISADAFNVVKDGELEAKFNDVEILVKRDGVVITDKDKKANVEPLVAWAATSIDPTVKESDVASAFKKVEETDSTETVGNVTITSKTEGESTAYTVAEKETTAKTKTSETSEKGKEATDNKTESDKKTETASTSGSSNVTETVAEKKTSNSSNSSSSSSGSGSSSSSNSSGSSSNTSSGSSTPAGGGSSSSSGSSTPSQPAHVHNFSEPVYTTVHHDATGHYVDVVTSQTWVVDQAAWDEPVYHSAYVCQVCGWYSTNGSNGSDMADHILLTHGGKASYRTDKVQVDTIHHDEVGHYVDNVEQQWVQDSDAYDEQVLTGYRCSCGAVQ